MVSKHQPTFVDSYILHRLQEQEQCWDEKSKQLHNHCPEERQGTDSAAAWVNPANLTESPMKMKSQGRNPHSTTKKSHLRAAGLRHESVPSKQSAPRGPLLEKRYRLGSIPAATSISCSSDTHKKRSIGTHSSSPSSSQRGFRKLRKRHPMNRSIAACSSSRGSPKTSTLGAFRPCHIVKNVRTTECGAHLYNLPRMGQRSKEKEHDEEIHGRWNKKLSERSHSLSASEKPINTRPSYRTIGRSSGVKMHGHKKSASVGNVGVARLWGCVGVKGWRGGECCCEDMGEELGASVMGDTISIEGTVYIHVNTHVHVWSHHDSIFQMCIHTCTLYM